MSDLQIPQRLKDLLDSNSVHNGWVQSNLQPFLAWMASPQPVFFPEYTDHGPKHVQGVLNSAAYLITEDSWKLLTSADAAVLCLAVLLHDAGMHLKPNNFIELVEGKYSKHKLEPLDKETWAELWERFLAEVTRFSDRDLINLFGEPDTGKTLPTFLRPQAGGLEEWLKNDDNKKIVGLFLRRNHPRLAHHIAVHGYPGATERELKLFGPDTHYRELIGLIARSHGMPLRGTFDNLKKKNLGERVYNKVHHVYLMAILRIADYLQVESGRADNISFSLINIHAPQSRLEWRKHQSVVNCSDPSLDSEAIKIDVTPPTVHIYLGMKWLLQSIQQELDTTWAVLGEVYGALSDKGLHKLGLKIRRVQSNLDNPEFAESVSYVPDNICFTTADAEVLNLLIGPLYGEDPMYGVRELIQNAVDAVRERKDFEWQQRQIDNAWVPNYRLRDQEADIVLTLERRDRRAKPPRYFLTISDTGIGMQLSTIKNYFLQAGASFRNSNEWKDLHEDQALNTSRVNRSGRFGVGALSAFLISNELDVLTCHVLDNRCGYYLNAKIDKYQICVRKIRTTVGTTIRIPITGTMFDIFLYNPAKWMWYYDNEPSIAYRIGPMEHLRFDGSGIKTIYKSAGMNSFEWTPESNSLLKIKNPSNTKQVCLGALKIQWNTTYSNHVFINGITIGHKADDSLAAPIAELDLAYDRFGGGGEKSAQLKFPSLAVYDFGSEPLTNLQRTNLSTCFRKVIRRTWYDVAEFVVSQLLESLPIYPKLVDSYYIKGIDNRIRINDVRFASAIAHPTPDGWTVLLPNVLLEQNINTLRLLLASRFARYAKGDQLESIPGCQIVHPDLGQDFNIVTSEERVKTQESFVRELVRYSEALRDMRYIDAAPDVGIVADDILFNINPEFMHIFDSKSEKDQENLLRCLRFVPFDEVAIMDGNLSDFLPKTNCSVDECIAFVDMRIRSHDKKRDLTYLEQAWLKHIGPNFIPYDIEERKAKFADAFKELDRFIPDGWEKQHKEK